MPPPWDKYTPEQRAYVCRRQSKGTIKYHASRTQEQRNEVGRKIAKARMKTYANMDPADLAEHHRKRKAKIREVRFGVRDSMVEVEHERINDYAGVVTASQMRDLHG